jgi:cytochrome c2
MQGPCTLRANADAAGPAAPPAVRRGKACRKAGHIAVFCGCTLGAGAAIAALDEAERGRRLLAQYQCGSCHVIPGVAGATGRSAPTLVAFGRRSYIGGRWPNEGDALVRWIVAPRALLPEATMPAMGAGEADARAMAMYLKGLR